MRKFLFALAVTAVGLSAVPASAQPWRPQPVVQKQIRQDINQLENRIDRAAQRRTISQREAASLRRDALQVRQIYARFNRNGLDRREVAQLESQVNRVYQRLHMERRDWDGRRG